jgi:hypothetical protein
MQAFSLFRQTLNKANGAVEKFDYIEKVNAEGKMSNGYYPTAKYDLNDRSRNYEAHTAWQENGGYLSAQNLANLPEHVNSALEKKVELGHFFEVVELGANSLQAAFPALVVLKGGSRTISHVDGSIEYKYTQRDGSVTSI